MSLFICQLCLYFHINAHNFWNITVSSFMFYTHMYMYTIIGLWSLKSQSQIFSIWQAYVFFSSYICQYQLNHDSCHMKDHVTERSLNCNKIDVNFYGIADNLTYILKGGYFCSCMNTMFWVEHVNHPKKCDEMCNFFILPLSHSRSPLEIIGRNVKTISKLVECTLPLAKTFHVSVCDRHIRGT